MSLKGVVAQGWKSLLAVRDLNRRLFPSARKTGAAFSAWARAALETAVFCFSALAARVWLDPQDPFGIHAQFPWLWIVPAMLAMRYGTAIGVFAVLLVVGAWFGMATAGLLPGAAMAVFPQAYFLGGLILALVCGQFSDVWNARGRRLRAVNAYLDERLQTLTRNHFLLRLSHERLEQDLLAKPLTLRETLVRLRNLSFQGAPDGRRMPGAAEFIQMLGQSCQLESAAVYALDGEGEIEPQPQAELGTPSALAQNDPLIQYCLEQKALAHIQSESITEDRRDSSRYLVCAPLLASNGKILGVLTVERLPFFALNHDTLQLLSVLAGYYADGLNHAELARDLLRAAPGCPVELAIDVMRLHRIRHQAGIESSLVALVFEKNQEAQDLLEQVRRLKRGVDLSWETAGERHCALITLLPLASSAAVEGYLLRIESAIHAQTGVSLQASRVGWHSAQLGQAAPVDTLRELVERCAL